MSKELHELEEDVQNRKNELRFFDALIAYLRNRDDVNDPNPEFRQHWDYGFISDVTVLLLPLHPLLVRYLPDNWNMENDLSQYLRENCDLQLGVLGDYDNDKCLDNLVKFLCEKKRQYIAKKKELEEASK